MSTVRERKLATILFADLVGSTALGGSVDPEYTRDLLDRFWFEAIGLDWHAEKMREHASG